MKYKKLDLWFNSISECLNIEVLPWDEKNGTEISNAFQKQGHEKIQSLLISHSISATDQYEQFEKEVIKNFKNNISAKGWSNYLQNKIQKLQVLTANFTTELSIAYFDHFSDTDDVTAILQGCYQKKSLDMLAREIGVMEAQKEIVEFPLNDELIPCVIVPVKLSIAYASYLLLAVEQTITFLENQLAIHDFQEPLNPVTRELNAPIVESVPTSAILWNSDASALYGLFGQLMTIEMPSGLSPIHRVKGDGTIKTLAYIIHKHFQFANGKEPSLDVIERQLQAMAQPENPGAKRNRIILEITTC